MILKEEKINRNFLSWVEYLKKYDCYSQEMIDELGDKLKKASFSMNKQSGGGVGTMIDIVLTKLCTIATHVNKLAFGDNEKGKLRHENLYVDQTSLMKVLLLQHISKALLFTPETEAWKINKGTVFDFNPEINGTLKLGEFSVYLCMKYGIVLTMEEYEAMKIIDRKDEKFNPATTPLSELVKIANEYCAIELLKENS